MPLPLERLLLLARELRLPRELEPLELEMAGGGVSCAQTIVSASHCVGLTLPGMIELPGSFSGSWISPRPLRGPEPRSRRSLATLLSAQAAVFSAPDASTMASWAASAANLFGAVSNGRPVSSAMSFAMATS